MYINIMDAGTRSQHIPVAKLYYFSITLTQAIVQLSPRPARAIR